MLTVDLGLGLNQIFRRSRQLTMVVDSDGHAVIRLSTATMAVIAGGLTGLGAGFISFYNVICIPQINYLQQTKDTVTAQLERLEESLNANTLATVRLRDELSKHRIGESQ